MEFIERARENLLFCFKESLYCFDSLYISQIGVRGAPSTSNVHSSRRSTNSDVNKYIRIQRIVKPLSTTVRNIHVFQIKKTTTSVSAVFKKCTIRIVFLFHGSGHSVSKTCNYNIFTNIMMNYCIFTNINCSFHMKSLPQPILSSSVNFIFKTGLRAGFQEPIDFIRCYWGVFKPSGSIAERSQIKTLGF